ncbi:hypothetical protein XELAEV_18041927mg [Xenopus laevis]|uniref:Zinc finger CCHC domain-containing protein n=1 Tax=Xenopus laevis TaxID=8355 RepID=A0A974H5K4_XENLA|nr:hypothetical protein XELAEV_18041927mg [Xenopus laevis]
MGLRHVAGVSRPRLRSSSAGTPTTPWGETSSENEMEKFVADSRRQKQRSAAAAQAQEGRINPPGAAKTELLVKVDGKQSKQMQGKQGMATDEEIKHKGMETQSVPLIVNELPIVSVDVSGKKPVSVSQTDINVKNKETVLKKLNLCQNPPQKCVTGACEQQRIQGCAEKQAEAPLCELESVGQVGEESGAAINHSVHVLQPTCQETGTPDTAARLYTGVVCKAQVPVQEPSLCKLSKAHRLCEEGLTEEKVLSLKGTDTKEPKIKGKVKETLTAEKVAEALKELATLQNKKKKLQLAIKSVTHVLAISEGNMKELNARKRDELRGELADIDFQISELYKDVDPWKEIYQNKQRFETMGSNVRGSVSKPVLQKSYQARKVNWQNMAFDQQDKDNQEKRKSVIKTFKVNKQKKDLPIERSFELSSDQDFPDLPKVKGKLNVKSPCKSASVRSDKQREGVLEAGEESGMESGTVESDTMESGAVKIAAMEVSTMESGTVEICAMEIGAIEIDAMEIGTMESGTVEIGAMEIGAMESGVQGRSSESERVQVQVSGNAGNDSTGELAGNRQVEVDQAEAASVEVESIQVGGDSVQRNPASFWDKRRLFPVPDLSDNEPFKRKNWVKIKWDGTKEDAPPDGLGFSPDDLSAIMAQTDIDFDVTFKLPEALDHFWKIYNVQKRAVKIYDEDNVWAGAWCTQVKLEVVGNVPNHLPNSFSIGKEKGTCFYVGQPRRCFKCGAGNHFGRTCKVLKYREMRREMQPVGGEREQEQDTEPPLSQEGVSKKQRPVNSQKRGKMPEKEVRGKEVKATSEENVEGEGWKIYQKRKTKQKYAHQLDPGEGGSEVLTFSLSTGNKFSVLDIESWERSLRGWRRKRGQRRRESKESWSLSLRKSNWLQKRELEKVVNIQ